MYKKRGVGAKWPGNRVFEFVAPSGRRKTTLRVVASIRKITQDGNSPRDADLRVHVVACNLLECGDNAEARLLLA